MQFQVPQFTDVEDKIFGPLTFKQFVYMGGAGGIAFLLWRFLPNFMALPLAVAVLGLGAALAFIQINKKPLIFTLEASFLYFIHSKLYLWKANHQNKKKKEQKAESLPSGTPELPALSENKLKSLAWSLDINERVHLEREKDGVELQEIR